MGAFSDKAAGLYVPSLFVTLTRPKWEVRGHMSTHNMITGLAGSPGAMTTRNLYKVLSMGEIIKSSRLPFVDETMIILAPC